MTDTNLSSFIWSVADLLRGDYKQSEYGRVILPFYVFKPPRPLEEIDAELKACTDRILGMIEALSDGDASAEAQA